MVIITRASSWTTRQCGDGRALIFQFSSQTYNENSKLIILQAFRFLSPVNLSAQIRDTSSRGSGNSRPSSCKRTFRWFSSCRVSIILWQLVLWIWGTGCVLFFSIAILSHALRLRRLSWLRSAHPNSEFYAVRSSFIACPGYCVSFRVDLSSASIWTAVCQSYTFLQSWHSL